MLMLKNSFLDPVKILKEIGKQEQILRTFSIIFIFIHIWDKVKPFIVTDIYIWNIFCKDFACGWAPREKIASSNCNNQKHFEKQIIFLDTTILLHTPDLNVFIPQKHFWGGGGGSLLEKPAVVLFNKTPSFPILCFQSSQEESQQVGKQRRKSCISFYKRKLLQDRIVSPYSHSFKLFCFSYFLRSKSSNTSITKPLLPSRKSS